MPNETFPRPTPLPVSPDAIPAELKAMKQWVCWDYKYRPQQNKHPWTKVPADPDLCWRADPTDPTTWTTFERAFAAYQKGQYDGIGFVLAADNRIVGIDLDHCRDPETGELGDVMVGQTFLSASEIVQAMASYTEVSPSGTGLRILAKGTLPRKGRHRDHLEMYMDGRFLTITGCHLTETPATIESRDPQIVALHAQVWPPHAPSPPAEHGPHGQSPAIGDDELIELALSAKNGEKFAKLWRGEIDSYPSHSEADLALCNMLAFYTQDAVQINRLFRESELYRIKWDRDDYRDRTITEALSKVTEHYHRRNGDDSGGMTHEPESAQDQRPSTTIPWSDQKNAELLVKWYGRHMRYCEAWGCWLTWEQGRWKIDETGRVMRFAKQTIKRLLDHLDNIESEAERKALFTHIKRSLSMHSLDAMVKSARSEPGISVTPEMFDRDPWLFNVKNGTIDLRTGELRQHNRDDLLTKMSPVAYDAEADCPLWKKFLSEIYDGDEELIAFFQDAFGYTLTGITREQVLFICHGPGCNGKSTQIRVMKEIMGEGEYALKTNLKAFTEATSQRQPTSIEYYIAKLHNVRLAYASEGDEGAKFSEGLIKDVTGGEPITGRHPYGRPFTFQPLFKLWFGTNHEPIITGTDQAIWRRPRKIPYNVNFEDRKDDTLFEKLTQELPGILRWAVMGCLLWQEHGLKLARAVKDATDAYRQAMDVVGRFIAECCVLIPSTKVDSTALYQAYVKWCADNGETALSQRKLAAQLHERGLKNDSKNEVTRRIQWTGIGLEAERAQS
jgi:putative DNA primase/helicase